MRHTGDKLASQIGPMVAPDALGPSSAKRSAAGEPIKFARYKT
jgi:hypothetical protein